MAEVKKLGELLKEAGLIDDFQLQSALSHQRSWGGKLGSILVELEFASEEEVARVIAQKLRMPYINLFEPEIPEASITLIKPEVAKKYVVMPVRQEGKAIVLAMADPLDIGDIDELRFNTGMNIKPALALESEIKAAISKYYDHEEVQRKPRPMVKDVGHGPGKMEIIHGSDLNMKKSGDGEDESTVLLSRKETVLQGMQDTRIRLDALVTLLIEKDLITREELINIVYQKKMGL